MNPDAIELTKRYVDSFKEYFTNIPDDRLLAAIMNPLLATYGFKDMTVILEDEGGAFITNRAKIIPKKAMHKIWKTKLEADVRKASDPVERVEEVALDAKEDHRKRLQLSCLSR